LKILKNTAAPKALKSKR